MQTGQLSAVLKNKEVEISGWISQPSPITGELFIKAGYSSVLIDLQHGSVGSSEARDIIKSVSRCGGQTAVRICVNEFSKASWLLDAGADMIVAPMINTVSEARELIKYCKYPPLGNRSLGPAGAIHLSGESMQTYFARANQETLAVAMVETNEAIAVLDDLLSLEGMDGIFVGPSDLAVNVSNGERIDPLSESSLQLQQKIARKAVAAGKFAGIYGINESHVQRAIEAGYQYITYGTDVGLFMEAAMRASAVTDGESRLNDKQSP
ncbi:HpcH/HpaI aldolase family protein [Endozoicomonas lisbonensis]|uniref:4-hydroxy-2-oxoheptanedioate aldolase n=1 Tax=Endozoicomonas lisbonensis TaxID=3120522 RepID=A0ABV2SE51_9GAMM